MDQMTLELSLYWMQAVVFQGKRVLVGIELKASKATYSTLGQILSYMASIKMELKAENVRGIIVAEEFDKKLMLAVTLVNNVKLIKYKVKFDFEAV